MPLVIIEEFSSTHNAACAVIFFVFQDVVMALLLKRAVGKVSQFSLAAKVLCTVVGCLATVGRCILDLQCITY